jgi:hypothetical protein
MAFKELKSNNDVFKSVKILSDYVNKYLIWQKNKKFY